jgi:hypothetical protein
VLDSIIVKGARVHNLKNINVIIPRDEFVVITGPSGSGKSSLAFDTLYAEGQRRYVESLSAYASQFLKQMQKPDVDVIEGLSPSSHIYKDRGKGLLSVWKSCHSTGDRTDSGFSIFTAPGNPGTGPFSNCCGKKGRVQKGALGDEEKGFHQGKN